jgi:diguanylate cyclase (GGDEF)-like protein
MSGCDDITDLQINHLKTKQELASAKILIILFYAVFVLYELIIKITGFHKAIVPTEQYPTYTLIQNLMYGFILLVLPFLLITLKRNPYQVKYLLFGLYIGAYTVFEIIVYSLIDMEYGTATITDMILLLTVPIFVNKRYFKMVFGFIIAKILLITFLTGNPLVFLGVIIFLFIGAIAWIILVQFTNYIKYTNHLHEAERELEWFKSIAYKDELTGAYTKRFINLELQELSNEQNQAIGYVMMDLDNFKEINDRYNHDVGDQVLQRIVKLIQEALDYDDLIGRYGGDEFILLLKNKSFDEMKIQVEGIKNRLETTKFDVLFNETILSFQLTASFGFYFVIENNDVNPIDALKEADNRLIQSKQKGKNQLTFN